MSEMECYGNGQFSWADLMTPSAAESKLFYAAAFGWSHQDNPTDQGGVYTQFLCRDLPVVGMGEMSSDMKKTGVPCHWNSYISVDDVDVIAAKCEQLGGKVTMPVMKVMNAGRMAFLEDTTRAQFAVWQRGDHIGARLVNEPVSLCWNELYTNDVEKAKTFYGDLFGWTFESHATDAGDYNEIQTGGRSNGGILKIQKEWGSAPPRWIPYFAVDDCDEAVNKIGKLGGKRMSPSVDIPAGRFAMVMDGQGATFSVIRLANPE